MSQLNLREKVTLWILGLYLLLNYGFMHVAFVIPTGELLLVWCVISLNWPVVISRFHKQFYIVPLLAFWAMGFVQALLGSRHYGFWSFRDASQCYESIYILIGFAFASTLDRARFVFKWWHFVLGVCSVYGLLFAWKVPLSSASPHLSGGVGGGSAALLFNFEGILLLMITYSTSLLIAHRRDFFRRYLDMVFAIAIIGYMIGIYQSRTSYLIMIAVTGYVIVMSPRHIGKWSILVIALVAALVLISVTGIQIQGRLHQNISFDFIQKHFAAISGKEDEGVTGAAEGSQQRMAWWLAIIHNWLATPTNFLFGRGYGFPLTDLVTAAGVPVREPHNSAMSVIGRLGLIGIVSWLWIQLLLVQTWFRALRHAIAHGTRNDVWRLKSLMVYFIAVWIMSMTEPGFELSFICIPFYFMWGVVIRYSAHLKLLSAVEDHTAQSAQAV